MSASSHLKRISALLLLIAIQTAVTLANAQTSHSLMLWLDGGATSFFDNIEESKYAIGGGGGAGFGYELQHKHFLLDIGVGFEYGATSTFMHPYTVDIAGLVDSEGDTYTGHFTFDQRRDNSNLGYVNIPLLMGGRFNHFYFLVGAKLGVNLIYNANVQSNVTVKGTYDKYLGLWENMPNHNFGTTELATESPIAFNSIDLKGSLEMGYRFDIKKPNEWSPTSPVSFRIGGFIDYGILNANSGINNYGYATVPENGDVGQISMNHVFVSNLAEEKLINNFFVGVKFTILFRMPSPKDCRCDFY
ncbi:MAG: hypothetical protein IAA73_03835 [Bacteroidetes bacterium]|uniref:Outer membrane protein beta-barrel domain-containing protein n=1 Tax=Candidatus Gallipaludibacter merdavium TaxID=2840839 RepID=A0A9D9HT45_9BACT|nr:hypothetical protein [Candidatus Gallipaludibacter merdavium]